ncbi:MAG: beta-lactamase family protein [SAR324 cluster bacterium]|nr:beta-lactamase family protein [SAR324 cluster bacterium]
MTYTISDQKYHELSQLVAQQLSNGVFPGIEILFAVGDDILLHQAWGYLDRTSEDPLQSNTLFDIASITKPVATALSCMILLEHGQLDLEDPVGAFIPEFLRDETKFITLRHLLTHTSGLPAWENLYADATDEDEAWNKLMKIPLACPTGTRMIYSCLGFIILRKIICKLSGMSLTEFFHKNIAVPLRLRHTAFNPVTHGLSVMSVAPTENCPWRKQLLRGVVHDENAFIFQGEGGNAGLFSTAEDLHRFCRMMLNGGTLEGQRVLSSRTVTQMIRNHNSTQLLPRGLGWDVKQSGRGYWSCGELFSDGSIGHTGFTGTSLWMDPVSHVVVIVLTNRVHLSREGNIPQMKTFRPRLHNFLLSLI